MKKKTNSPRGLTAVFEKLSRAGEDNEPDLRIAEDGQLVGLLQQPRAAFRERHLPRGLVLDPSDFYLSSAHFWWEDFPLVFLLCLAVGLKLKKERDLYPFLAPPSL